ncbi:MAG: flagellar hook-basal body complex protein [Planctomycetota bacterium]|nr:flagellar hook-basal body complex protein [Planctomycetota bacterium]
MGLASALSTALTGLTAAETTIDVVGNNLANSGTVGFKASEAQFSTQFLQTRGLGSAPSGNSGGTNPRQVGLGVQVAEITPDFGQGTIEVSSNPSDLAIQGDGFFIVQGSTGEQLYTRNGVLKTNSSNELITISGDRILGYGVDADYNIEPTNLIPIQIPLGAAAVAQATENVYFEGTLTPTGDLATRGEIIQSAVLGDESYLQPPGGAVAQNAVAPNVALAGTTATDTGTPGGADAGNYSYKIVFVDVEGNESIASTNINVTTAGNNEVLLDDLPTSADYAGLRIYRNSLASPDTFRLVSTPGSDIPMGTTSFTDDVTTATWGTRDELDDSLIDGNYSYYVTFFNPVSGVESRPSPLIGPFNVNDGRVLVRAIPESTDPNITSGPYSVRLYRNLSASASTFYQVADFVNPGPGEPRTFVDSNADSAIVNPANALDFDGPKINSNTILVNIIKRDGANYLPLFEEGSLEFTGKKGGAELKPPKLFTITATSTAQDLVNFMNDSLGIRATGDDSLNTIPQSESAGGPVSPGGSVTGDGRLQFVGNNGTGNAIDIDLSAFRMVATGSNTPTNPQLGFQSIQAAVGQSAIASFQVFDSLGIPLNVRVTSVLESRDSTTTTYRWFADSGDNDPQTGVDIQVGTGLIRFDGEGNVIGVTNDTASIDRANVASIKPLEFTLDFSQLSGLATSKSSLAATRQDGSSAGTLSSFIVGEDGIVRGVFTNGITRELGQIRLARFANPAGLEQRGENLFASGVNSGLPIEGNPGEQGIGGIVAGATELSNTDIGKNLIDLILASTMYRGNTRVITTSQQLFDELLNLRR